MLSNSEGWRGQEQLASQVLARLADEGEEAERLKGQAVAWLHKTGGAPPLAASLVAKDALLRTLPVGSSVNALAVIPDGRLASGFGNASLRLWDPARPDGAPRLLFVADAAITALVVHPTCPLLVAGDGSWRLHWLQLPTAQHHPPSPPPGPPPGR